MPTLTELQNRLPNQRDSRTNRTNADEYLVTDTRGRLTPAQMVEQKLRGLLAKAQPEPGSRLPVEGFQRLNPRD